jgi:ribosomal protein S18 acetylase RimI-like enzyme
MQQKSIKLNFEDSCKEFEELWNEIYSTKEVIVFDASLYPSYLVIELIQIKISDRRKGFGTLVMNKIIEFAKKHNKDILLFADESFGTPKEYLLNFYEKFGFTENDCSVYSGAWQDYLIYKTLKE